MTREEVVDLMASSNSEDDWNTKADLVIEACGGYPEFWFGAVILSGLMRRTSANWLS